MTVIYFIRADNCRDCQRMKQCLNSCVDKYALSKKVNIIVIDSESDEAINVAIENGILEIPGCCINGKAIYGKNFTESQIEAEMKKI